MAGPTALAANRRVAHEASPAPFLYRALRGPVRRALARWFDLSIEGLEHLPAGGPYLIAANHHNYLDGVVLGVAAPEPISFLVMPRVWRATPLHPILHRHLGSIPIDLGRADVSAAQVDRDRAEVAVQDRMQREALAGRRGYIPRRVPLGVRFGPARCFSEDGANGRRSIRLHVTRRIMDDIAALLS